MAVMSGFIRSNNLLYKNAVFKDAPHTSLMKGTSSDFNGNNGSHIISGCDRVDYMTFLGLL